MSSSLCEAEPRLLRYSAPSSRCFGSSTRGSHSASPVGDASLVPFAPEARDGLPLATHDAASLVKSMSASCHKGLSTTCFHLTFGSHSQLGHTNGRDDRKDGFMLSSARRTSRLDSASVVLLSTRASTRFGMLSSNCFSDEYASFFTTITIGFCCASPSYRQYQKSTGSHRLQ